MNSKKNLVFLGMMGSGKSSIGFLVAKKLNLKFMDIDNIIEKEVGMKIVDIFKDKGESYFRILEEKNTLKVLNFNNSVISLGGGAFMNNKIRKKVLSNNFSFWLNWNAETLLIRIKKNKKRPLAFNSSDTELMSLIKSRSKIYSKAQIKINCNNLKKSEIIEKILKIYEPN